MPHTLTGDPNSFPTGISCPSDGDGPGIKAADIEPALQGLMDRTAALDARYRMIGAGNLKTSPAVSSGIPRRWAEESYGAVQAFNNCPLVDVVTGLTPFPAGVLEGDILEMHVQASGFTAGVWALRLDWSQSASDFFSGTYGPVTGTAGFAERVVGPSTAGLGQPIWGDGNPAVVHFTVAWSTILVPAAGFARVVIGAIRDVPAYDEAISVVRVGGAWKWWRAG